MFKRNLALASLMSAALLLTACDEQTDELALVAELPSEPVVLTSENAQLVVAAATVENYVDVISVSEMSAFDSFRASFKGFNVFQILGKRIELPFSCALNGEAALSFTFDGPVYNVLNADAEKRSRMVSSTINFDACENVKAVVIDGLIGGELLLAQKTLAVDFQNLSLSTPTKFSQVHGEVFVEIDAGSLKVYGDRMAGSANGDEFILDDFEVKRLRLDASETIAFSYNLTSAKVGGSVMVASQTPIERFYGDANPSFGSVQVLGADDTVVFYDADTGDNTTVAVSLNNESLGVFSWGELFKL